jgi:hypothetical protein
MQLAGVAFQACSFIRPPLASEFSASYGEMSRRSGFAAKADNHSDISPLWNHQLTVTREPRFLGDCDKSSKGDALTLAAIKYSVMNARLECSVARLDPGESLRSDRS